VEKVLFYKRKYGNISELDLSVVGSTAHRQAVEAISLESICLVRGNLSVIAKNDKDTIFVGSYPYRTDQASSHARTDVSFPLALSAALSTDHLMTSIDPDQDEINQVINQVAGFTRVVIGLYNAIDNAGQLELVNRLSAKGHQVTAIALGKPYDLDVLEGDICGLAAFEYTPLVLQSLIQIMSGAYTPTGKLSING